MFKLLGKVLNEYFNTNEFQEGVLYSIDKTYAGNGPLFYPYWISNPIDKYSKFIDEDTIIKLHTIYIQNKMKDERDFYEGEIKGINYFIYRIYGHLNGYIELSEDDYFKIDTTSLDVHGGITFVGDIKDLNLPAGNYKINSKAIGFDTAHAGDAFLCEGFEYTLKNGEYRDYQFVYNELVKLVNQLPKEMLTTDGQRYLKNFIQEVKDFENLSEGDFFMENYKEHLTNLLTELITKYVELEGDMSFVIGYINSNGNYVTLQDRTDSNGLDYSIRSTMLDSEYGNEIEGGEIIFQFDDNYYGIDIDELKYYREDFNDYIKDKDKYIKDKVDYIISLTY